MGLMITWRAPGGLSEEAETNTRQFRREGRVCSQKVTTEVALSYAPVLFMQIQVSNHCHFFSLWRTSSNISYMEGLLVTNSFNFCLTKSLFLLNCWRIISQHTEFYVGRFFSLNTFSIPPHILLAYMVSMKIQMLLLLSFLFCR